ncbi:unnamed protein product [Durusdinium trenchii]|uniref:Uncharacterized protein n=1 Tax=Durusdinium trenchii TaxID=1381693 RepID=A0ABP0LCS1_9DINO
MSLVGADDLPPVLTALIVRYTVKKFSGGREDLLPDDIDDPELLLRALVRKYQFELQAAKSSQFRAETQAENLKKQVESLQEASEEAQTLAKEATSKLAYAERRVGDYRSRIACLGSKWESITGFSNDELERNPSAAAKRFKGELRATQSEIFNEKMTIRRLQKELKVVKEMLTDSEGSFAQLYEELASTRLKDEELEDMHNGLENKARVAAVALEEQKKIVAEKSETVRGLLARVHELEAHEGDVHRKKAAAERKAVVLEREIEEHVEDIKRMESKYHEGVETTMILEKRCKEEEAKLQEERLKVVSLTEQLAEEKHWTAQLKQDLAKAHAEIEGITEEKTHLFKENKSLDKKGIMEGKRAREAESEAKKVREMLADSSHSLVTTTHELGDEKKKVNDLEGRLEDTRGTVKEYQELAAVRKNIVERLEKEVYDLKEQLKDAEVRELSLSRQLKKTQASLLESVDREKEAGAETVRVVSSLDMSQREFQSLQGEVGGLELSIEDLKGRLEDAKEDARAYRKRTFDLEDDLKKENHRAAESEEREYHLKVECKSLKQKLAKEEDVIADLSEKVELMNAQLLKSQAMYAEVKSKEASLFAQIEKYKEKHQDAVERGDVLEKSLAHVEDEVEVYKGQTGVLREEIHDKKQKLRVEKKNLAMTATDLDSLKESLGNMASDLSKSKKLHSEAALRVEVLEKEIVVVKEKLEDKTSLVAKLEKEIEELNVKLEDAMFAVTEERKDAKTVVELLQQKEAALRKVEKEAVFSKESVKTVCDDIKVFQDREVKLREESKELEGEIERWKVKFEESQVEIAKLQDINWRIAEDLKTSKVSLREVEAVAKKTTMELKSGKGRMVDAEAKNIELTANVAQLMEALIQAEAREKEALELAEGRGMTHEKKKKKMLKAKTSASMS